MNKKTLNNKLGFTLVELLVVVAIIGILSTIGLVLFNSAQQNARDARRKADIESIANALETKRQPGAPTYSAITGGDFSSGSIPIDTTNQKYCIRLYTGTNDAKTATGGMTNAWGGASNTCPENTQLTSSGALDWSVAVPSFAANTYKSWVVCAKLENTDASPNYYCKYSSQ